MGPLLSEHSAMSDLENPDGVSTRGARQARPGAARRALEALDADRGLIVTGPTGVGKTSFLDEVLDGFDVAGHGGCVVALSARDLRDGGPDHIDEHLATASSPHVVLRIEDAETLDRACAHDVADRVRAGSVTLVTTHRNPPPLCPAFANLWKDDLLTRVDLEPLGPEATAEVLESLLGGPVSADLVRFMLHTVGGNLRHLDELTVRGVETGTLVEQDGVWVVVDDVAPTPGIADLIISELAALDPSIRDVVELVALSQPLPLPTLLTLVDADVVDQALSTGVITVRAPDVAQHGVVCLVDPSRADALRRTIPPGRRHDLHGRIEPLAPTSFDPSDPTTGEHLIRCVVCALECGRTVGIDLLTVALAAAEATDQRRLVRSLATTILQHPDCDTTRRVAALGARGAAARFLGDIDTAFADTTRAVASIGEPGHGVPVATAWAAVTAHADVRQYGRDDPDGAFAVLDEFARDHGDDVRARLAVDRYPRLVYAQRFGEARACRPREKFDAPTDVRLAVEVASLVLDAFTNPDDEVVHRAEALVVETGSLGSAANWFASYAQAILFLVRLWRGERGEAAELYRLTGALHDTDFFVDSTVRQLGAGYLADADGDDDRALAHFTAATAHLRVLDFSGWSVIGLTGQAMSTATSGDLIEAARLLDAARAAPVRAAGFLFPELRSRWCRTAIALGRPDAADLATELAAMGRRDDLGLVELWGLHALALLGAAGSTAGTTVPIRDRIDVLAESMTAPLPEALVWHARTLVADDRSGQVEAAHRVATLGYRLPVRRVTTAELTRRQREVAALVVKGCTNREIAERLHISVRTAETHIAHIFLRLGINSRAELAVVHGPVDPGR